jgi:hypothetical protein
VFPSWSAEASLLLLLLRVGGLLRACLASSLLRKLPSCLSEFNYRFFEYFALSYRQLKTIWRIYSKRRAFDRYMLLTSLTISLFYDNIRNSNLKSRAQTRTASDRANGRISSSSSGSVLEQRRPR